MKKVHIHNYKNNSNIAIEILIMFQGDKNSGKRYAIRSRGNALLLGSNIRERYIASIWRKKKSWVPDKGHFFRKFKVRQEVGKNFSSLNFEMTWKNAFEYRIFSIRAYVKKILITLMH